MLTCLSLCIFADLSLGQEKWQAWHQRQRQPNQHMRAIISILSGRPSIQSCTQYRVAHRPKHAPAKQHLVSFCLQAFFFAPQANFNLRLLLETFVSLTWQLQRATRASMPSSWRGLHGAARLVEDVALPAHPTALPYLHIQLHAAISKCFRTNDAILV